METKERGKRAEKGNNGYLVHKKTQNKKKGKGSNLALNYCQKYTPHKSESRSSNLALIKYKLGQM